MNLICHQNYIYIYILYNSKSLSNIKQLNNFLLNLYFENSIIKLHVLYFLNMYTNFHINWIFITIRSINSSFIHYFKLQKLEFERLINDMIINL